VLAASAMNSESGKQPLSFLRKRAGHTTARVACGPWEILLVQLVSRQLLARNSDSASKRSLRHAIEQAHCHDAFPDDLPGVLTP
jgi:hypothetical protein